MPHRSHHKARRWQFQYHNSKKFCNRSFLSLKSVSLINFFLFRSQVIFPQCQPSSPYLCIWTILRNSLNFPVVFLFSFFTITLCDFTVPGKEPLDVLITDLSQWPLLPVPFCHTIYCSVITLSHLGHDHILDLTLGRWTVAPPSSLAKVFTSFHLLWVPLQPDLCCQSPQGSLYNCSQEPRSLSNPVMQTSPLHIHAIRVSLAGIWQMFTRESSRTWGIISEDMLDFFLCPQVLYLTCPYVLNLFRKQNISMGM